jgi:hypothetical protein
MTRLQIYFTYIWQGFHSRSRGTESVHHGLETRAGNKSQGNGAGMNIMTVVEREPQQTGLMDTDRQGVEQGEFVWNINDETGHTCTSLLTSWSGDPGLP